MRLGEKRKTFVLLEERETFLEAAIYLGFVLKMCVEQLELVFLHLLLSIVTVKLS